MQKTVDFLSDQLRGFQVDNVSMAMVESVRFMYHGQPTPIKHLASTSQENRRISLQLYDVTVGDSLTKCLVDSGFDAYKFSANTVIVTVPLPSGEQREKTLKRMKQLGEETKVALRNLRKKWKKQGIDEKDLNNITGKYVDMVDKMIW